jgi:hypothetical protein
MGRRGGGCVAMRKVRNQPAAASCVGGYWLSLGEGATEDPLK